MLSSVPFGAHLRTSDCGGYATVHSEIIHALETGKKILAPLPLYSTMELTCYHHGRYRIQARLVLVVGSGERKSDNSG
ncbi:hypothetical protein MTO96_006372 [Rhipicephalus appendiculatus]